MFPVLPRRSRSLGVRPRGSLHLETPGGAHAPLVRPIRAARPEAPAPRILIAALDSLTDVVVFSALTPLLRRRFPDSEITLWCARSTASIAALVPGIDRVERADPYWEAAPDRIGSLAPFVGTVLRLRRNEFDVALLGNAHWRARIAVAVTRASRRVGLSADGSARWLTDVVAPNAALPMLYDVAQLVERIDVPVPTNLHYRLGIETLSERRARVRSLLGPRPIALQPFAGKRGRGVAITRWIRLAAELVRRGYDPVWIGRSGELRDVRRTAGSDAWTYIDSLGDGEIADVAATVSLAHLYIGHDSGLLHLARALGTPTIGIYTDGEPPGGIPDGVSESRALVRRSPEEVTCDQMIAAVDALPRGPVLRLLT